MPAWARGGPIARYPFVAVANPPPISGQPHVARRGRHADGLLARRRGCDHHHAADVVPLIRNDDAAGPADSDQEPESQRRRVQPHIGGQNLPSGCPGQPRHAAAVIKFMMQPEIAVLRFGLGARPGDLAAARGDAREWLRTQTRGMVPLMGARALAPSRDIFAGLLAAREERRATTREAADQSGIGAITGANVLRDAYLPHYRAQVLARAQSAALTTRPFAERLVHFWSNHFAVSADKGAIFGLAGTLENEAIRPHVNGRFVDLLTAVEQHPAMLAFLDNQYSAGADSVAAQAVGRRPAESPQPKRQFGINENLAREILELHTLGVNGGYTQSDVTSFAEIITGWSIGGANDRLAGGETGRFFFREKLHEPGTQTVLGKHYPEAGRAQGEAVLADLARHPATARFIATKLTRHFVADEPPAATVERVARTFLKSDGDLPRVYAALIDSPEAWEVTARKFKTPQDLVFSTLRAFDTSPGQSEEVIRSFDFLGQRQYTPGSPAGWPDVAAAWDGSDALLHRVSWTARAAERYDRGIDPIALAASALGARARVETMTALRRAASGTQAVALLLMSPEFQRR